MADWRDDFREGSFRGVSFKTESHEFRGGRRNVDHEFPSKEEGNSEDIGKRLPRYNLSLLVIGDDYFAQRDALLEALETEGAGELIHPYLGTKQVQVGAFTLSETKEEGRMARFNVEFIESGVPKFPAEDTDAIEAALQAVEDTLEAAQNAFATAATVANSPARVAEAAAATVSKAVDQVEQVAKTAGTVADGIASVAFAVREIKNDINTLLNTPAQLAARFQGAIALLFDAVGDDTKGLSNALSSGLSGFRDDEIVVPADTPTTLRLKSNQLAIENLVVESSVAAQAQAALSGNYVSVNDALDTLGLFNDDLSAQLDRLSDDDLYQRMKDLEVAVNKALPPQNTGEILTFTPPIALPALVISHQIFGDIDKAEEIIQQNKVRHPGFVPGRIPIEVSSG